jgi:hypothetical protein
VGFKCESGNFVGGSLEDSQDTKTNLEFTRKSRGLIAKLPGLLLPLARSEQGGGSGWSGQIAGAPAA